MTRHPSHGLNLYADWNGGTSYGQIGQIKDWTGPGLSRDSNDVSDHDIADFMRVFVAGLTDPGECSFDVNLDPHDSEHLGTGGTGMFGSMQADPSVLNAFKVELPGIVGGTLTMTFDGFVNAWEPSAPVGGSLSGSVGIKVSGAPSMAVT